MPEKIACEDTTGDEKNKAWPFDTPHGQ